MTPAFETMQRESAICFPFLGSWTINPPAYITVFGRNIYLYGILIALGFVLAITVCARIAPKFGISADSFYDLAIWMIPMTILGARLYFVAFRWDYYAAHPTEIFAVWEGGLAIYGGIIAGFLTCWVFCRVKKISFPAMLDVLAFGILIGQILGRWGNFFNREAFGAETDRHCILIYFFWYGLGRAWIEGLRTDSLYIGTTGIRVSQLLSIVLVLVSGTLLFLNRNNHSLQERAQAQEEAQNGKN